MAMSHTLHYGLMCLLAQRQLMKTMCNVIHDATINNNYQIITHLRNNNYS